MSGLAGRAVLRNGLIPCRHWPHFLVIGIIPNKNTHYSWETWLILLNLYVIQNYLGKCYYLASGKHTSTMALCHAEVSKIAKVVENTTISDLSKILLTNLWLHNCFNTAFDACFKYLCLRQLFVPMGCQPNTSQWALLAQHKMCIKHFLDKITTNMDNYNIINVLVQSVTNYKRQYE